MWKQNKTPKLNKLYLLKKLGSEWWAAKQWDAIDAIVSSHLWKPTQAAGPRVEHWRRDRTAKHPEVTLGKSHLVLMGKAR